MTYSFRNRLVLSGGLDTSLLGEPDEVTRVVLADQGPNGVVELFGPGDDATIRDAIELRLRGRNFPTFEAALVAGRVWRNHLTIAFAHYLVGIKIGTADNPTTFSSGYGSPYYRESEGFRVRDEPGLYVFRTDDEAGPVAPGLLVRARVMQGLHGLVTHTLWWITQRNYDLSRQQLLAYALVHASYFEDNHETAFILLVTAIEALLPPREDEPLDIADVIDVLKEKLYEIPNLDADMREDVAGALEDDKFDPIGRRGRKLVSSLGTERFGGERPKDYFTRRYKIRSDLVHGSVDRFSEAELRGELPELRRFVLALLGVQVFGERMPEYWTPDTVPRR